jgi:hypothetical protein
LIEKIEPLSIFDSPLPILRQKKAPLFLPENGEWRIENAE